MIGNAMKIHLITRFAVVALVLFLACVGVRADQIIYTFSSGAGYSGHGDTAYLSGTFTWNTATNSIIASNINLTGYDATGNNTGPVSCTNCVTAFPDLTGGLYFNVKNGGPDGTRSLYLIFANSLSLGVDTPLALSAYDGGNQAQYWGGQTFTTATGYALVPAVPEPAALTLLATGLLGIGSLVRRRRNNT